MSATAVLLCFAAASSSVAGPFGPRDYDECILQNMKGVSGDLAASAVISSCRAKFPEAEPETDPPRSLTAKELLPFTFNVKAEMHRAERRVVLHLHNENPDFIITGITVAVVGQVDGKPTRKVYTASTRVAPQERTPVAFEDVTPVDSGAKWAIYVEGATCAPLHKSVGQRVREWGSRTP